MMGSKFLLRNMETATKLLTLIFEGDPLPDRDQIWMGYGYSMSLYLEAMINEAMKRKLTLTNAGDLLIAQDVQALFYDHSKPWWLRTGLLAKCHLAYLKKKGPLVIPVERYGLRYLMEIL